MKHNIAKQGGLVELEWYVFQVYHIAQDGKPSSNQIVRMYNLQENILKTENSVALHLRSFYLTHQKVCKLFRCCDKIATGNFWRISTMNHSGDVRPILFMTIINRAKDL